MRNQNDIAPVEPAQNTLKYEPRLPGLQERRELRKAEQAPGSASMLHEADGAPARAALHTLRSTKHRAPRARPAPAGAVGGVARPKRKGIFGPGSEPGKQSGGVLPILLPSRSPLVSWERACCSCHQ